jgi:hypothetical protein
MKQDESKNTNSEKVIYKSWQEQINVLKDEKSDFHKFCIPLPNACKEVLDETIEWLDHGYGAIVKGLEFLLHDHFPKYRQMWGWPK